MIDGQVPAGSTAEYKLVYKPLNMTSEGSPHEGSIFFPIPDGSGLLYRLHGQVIRAVTAELIVMLAEEWLLLGGPSFGFIECAGLLIAFLAAVIFAG